MKQIITLLLISLHFMAISQDDIKYRTEEYSLWGIFNNQPAYIDDDDGLYYPVVNSKLEVTEFKKYNFSVSKHLDFIHNDITVESFYTTKTIKIKTKNRERIFNCYLPESRASYNETNQMLTFAVKRGAGSLIGIYYLEKDTLVILPLVGVRPQLSDNYLYFATTCYVTCGSSFLYSLYRVKIDDWNNPEFIATDIDYSDWVLLPDSDILYIRNLGFQIAPNKYDDYNEVLYNANTQTFDTVNYEGSSRITKYNGKYYYAFGSRFLWDRFQPYYYVPVQYPDSFPFKTKPIVVPCRGTNRYEVEDVINMPNREKPFTGTFITDDLLYNASKQELSKLTKSELRILRNAFFARFGYNFKSKDLQEFFGKFDWYNELVDSNKTFELTNADLVVSPKDYERIKLIKEIEKIK